MVKVIYNCGLFNEENHKVMYAGQFSSGLPVSALTVIN